MADNTMLENLTNDLKETSYAGLARTFNRLGWCGFWTQLVVGAIPVLLMMYLFFFAGSLSGPRLGFAFVEYLTLVSLLVLAFTLFWSFRYTRLAKRLLDLDRRPTDAALTRASWTGIVGGTIGIFLSIIIILIEVAHLLFYFLSVPQAGVPVIQTTATAQTSWVSAVDMLSLMALTLMLFAEVVVLVFSLWLLFRVTIVSARSTDLLQSDPQPDPQH